MTRHDTTNPKAAEDDDLETVKSREISKQLHALAIEWEQCADRADTLDALDTRRRAAAQIRFVAVMTTSAGMHALGRVWVDAGRRMLDAVNAADMDAVHESRSRRRGIQ
jgi:hypothetical protein